MKKFELVATCAAGVEALVGNELRDLGYEVQVENGRVRFEGTARDIAKTNLWLRVADRVKIVIGEFEAKTFDDLFEKVETSAGKWAVKGKYNLFSVGEISAFGAGESEGGGGGSMNMM